ncbi:MAG: hypothetical protein ABJB34_03990 [Acidobacteriota bacterium]
MNTVIQHQPVILLLGKGVKTNDEVDAWLAESRYSAHEAADVFHVMEQISDFTVRDTPEVVYLHVDGIEGELAILECMLATTAGDSSASIIAFPGTERSSSDPFVVLARQLDKLIPDGPRLI